MMKVALGQFAVSREWQENASICLDLMQRATEGGADLLVLPEGVLARDIAKLSQCHFHHFSSPAAAGNIASGVSTW